MSQSGGNRQTVGYILPWIRPRLTRTSKATDKHLQSEILQSMDTPKAKHAPWKALFNFTTRRHVPIVIPAIICSAISGALITVNSYLLGKLFFVFTYFSSGALDEAGFKHEVRRYVLYIILIASLIWLFNSLGFFLWHTFGDLQARSARLRIFRALLTRQIEWFDKRKDGTSALTTRLLR
jgi:ATP-binding cassette subfamily B (MDR/TAP) protein 1